MKVQLRDHQTHAIEALRASLRCGKKRPMIQAPTGAGKTIILAQIIEGALAKGKRVLVTVPYLTLVDQTVDALTAQGIDSVGVIQGYHSRTDRRQPVQVASIQTLQRRTVPAADIVIVDEAHRWFRFSGLWMRRPEWRAIPFVGLSATPWTVGLGDYYDDLIVAATTQELIEKGLLAPFCVFAPSHPDLAGVRTMAGDFHEGQLANAMNKSELVGDIVTTWLRLGEDRPTLCFAVDRAHARRIAAEFEAVGIAAAYVDAYTPREERDAIARRPRAGQIKVIVNIATMTTGVDLDIRCIILARPTRSEILYTQMVGRGLRTAEGKVDCLILDHSDTTLRLGLVTDIHYEKLDRGATIRNARVQKLERPLPKECSSCSYLRPAGVHKCPSCGFEPVKQSNVFERSGELVQISGKARSKAEVTLHTQQQIYSMLLWVQDHRGYKPGYAAAKFRARYGTWPKTLTHSRQAPDGAFLNWLKSQEIAFHKCQQKGASHAA